MKKIIVFASGSGTNAENIINFFKNQPSAKVVSVLTNNSKAKVIERAENHEIPTIIFTKDDLTNGNLLQKIDQISPDLIVLAGFLLKFPQNIIQKYPDRVLNIHPALLPKFGGKGMYGMHIHKAVVSNHESETGITIHYVNENYDEGAIIFQAKTKIEPHDTADDVADKINVLEQRHFPEVILNIIESMPHK